jgi:hypothetical protein
MIGTGSTWDAYGQLVGVLMFVAMLAYVAPGAMTLTPTAQRWSQILAGALLAIALLIAIGASIAWFAG